MVEESQTLSGDVALVTGGGSGIGRALAVTLARAGARVAIADIEWQRAHQVAQEITESGGDAAAFCCDVASYAQVESVAEQVERAFGGVNLLVNNAGTVLDGGIDETTIAESMWLFEVNVLGMIHVIKAFLPLLRKQAIANRRAHIVNTGSENSLGVPQGFATSIYTATKHAVLGVSDTLRRDLAGTGINVSILCPGPVATRLWDMRRNRPTKYGGPIYADAETEMRLSTLSKQLGQDPAITAEICLQGITKGEFYIVTHPQIRDIALPRHREIERALDLASERVALIAALMK